MRRVVFDTTTVTSALAFTGGQLAWLRSHWRGGGCVPLSSRATTEELVRVLSYAKFGIAQQRRDELLADYLPFCEVVEPDKACAVQCRDGKDQVFLDLAESARADVLVSGDRDLLVLVGTTAFSIESPAAYRVRVLGA